jgi:hypothetical protein
MRLFVFAISALTLCACAEPARRQSAGCAIEATHQVTWSNAEAPDTITARAEGPDCTRAFVHLSIRNADGDPLWVTASTYYDLTAGGPPPPDAPPATAPEVQTFLRSWADVTRISSNELPAWADGMSRPGEGVGPLGYDSPLERETYEAMRERALPTLCTAIAAAAVQCLIIDPASHAPTILAAYGS